MALTKPPLDSTDAEVEQLSTLCDRLAGFDDKVSLDWLDGYLSALLAGPRVPGIEEWLPKAFGDAWERSFADPVDEQAARQVLQRRWAVLASQLDPQALEAEPDTRRMAPLMLSLDEATLAELAQTTSAEDMANLPPEGALWAYGFFEAVEAYADDWGSLHEGSTEAEALEAGLDLIALLLPDEDQPFDARVKEYFGKALSRDDVINEALFVVQDTRILWMAHPPRTAPIKAQPTAGRNDPCPCGSGRKFKKCHGA